MLLSLRSKLTVRLVARESTNLSAALMVKPTVSYDIVKASLCIYVIEHVTFHCGDKNTFNMTAYVKND